MANTEQELEELKKRLALDNALELERGKSDKKYAAKIVETIVFAVIAMLALTVLIKLFASIGFTLPTL